MDFPTIKHTYTMGGFILAAATATAAGFNVAGDMPYTESVGVQPTGRAEEVPMTISEPQMRAEIAAAEARTDTKFAKLSADIDTKLAEILRELGGLKSAVAPIANLPTEFVRIDGSITSHFNKGAALVGLAIFVSGIIGWNFYTHLDSKVDTLIAASASQTANEVASKDRLVELSGEIKELRNVDKPGKGEKRK